METTYRTTMCGGIFDIAADFNQASCQIKGTNGRQVSDFHHSPPAAMRSVLEQCIIDSGDDPDDYEDIIAEALENITEV